VVCSAAVNGLDNFRVGCLNNDELPSIDDIQGVSINPDVYPVCRDFNNTGVTTGLVLTVGCSAGTACRNSHYVIIQSVDMVAEKLCIAEVCVLETGQYIGNLCHLVLVSAATLLYLGLR